MTAPFYVPPEQLIKDRADFARKGIARGRPIVVLEYADGVLLIGENPSGSLHKLGEIYDLGLTRSIVQHGFPLRKARSHHQVFRAGNRDCVHQD